MSSSQGLRTTFYVLFLTRMCSVQADSSMTPQAEEIHRLQQEGLEAVQAERKAELQEHDNMGIFGIKRLLLQAKKRKVEDKEIAAKDFAEARSMEEQKGDANVTIILGMALALGFVFVFLRGGAISSTPVPKEKMFNSAQKYPSRTSSQTSGRTRGPTPHPFDEPLMGA